MASYGGLGGISGGREVDMEDLFEAAIERCFGSVMREERAACIEVWSALANTGWRHENGDDAALSFRAAGDLVAAIIGRGDYMDWYCSGPSEVVSERFSEAMRKEGWQVDPHYYDDLKS